jgi:2-polyprenyl-3-methyl-5-hydroxy-6-metoxy-1,4-benzoquinol methylase
MLAPRTEIPPHRPLDWEETPCLLCGRDESGLVIEAGDPIPAKGPGLRFAVVRCRHCGLAYTNPRPTPETIGQFYPPGYSPHESREARRRNRIPSRFWSRVFGTPCPERRGSLPHPRPGRLLDFGCGGGSYLRRMAALGWKVTGLDVSAATLQKVKAELGCDVHVGTLPHPDLNPGSFEAVTMWQALEHVHQPLAVLREAFRLLVPGGTLVAAVPNFDSSARGWFGEHWFGYDLPRHLTHFAPATLGAMLRAAGFRVTSLRGLVHAGWMRSSARRAIAAGAGTFGAKLLRWRPVARAAAWACYAAGRADCIVAVAERPA